MIGFFFFFLKESTIEACARVRSPAAKRIDIGLAVTSYEVSRLRRHASTGNVSGADEQFHLLLDRGARGFENDVGCKRIPSGVRG